MNKTAKYKNALGEIRQEYATVKDQDSDFKNITDPRDAVFARYQPIFSLDKVNNITEDEFLSFLLFKNNHHWTGLSRNGPKICSDMDNLKSELKKLLSENLSITERLNEVHKNVFAMGRATITAILSIAFPDKYGVWNSTSEGALKRLDIWPKFDHGETFGERYIKVNGVLLNLRDDLKLDLWTLDAVFYFINKQDDGLVDGLITDTDTDTKFGLERHLHDFLKYNWNNTELGQEWNIYSEPGDQEAGYEYPCAAGSIDILAKHKSDNRWLVVELKRGRTDANTVGQILKYIGWVRQELAKSNDRVEGIIIAREVDEGLKYALSEMENIKTLLYEIKFTLKAL